MIGLEGEILLLYNEREESQTLIPGEAVRFIKRGKGGYSVYWADGRLDMLSTGNILDSYDNGQDVFMAFTAEGG